eukprot:46030-Rhodomonas_salina.2
MISTDQRRLTCSPARHEVGHRILSAHADFVRNVATMNVSLVCMNGTPASVNGGQPVARCRGSARAAP